MSNLLDLISEIENKGNQINTNLEAYGNKKKGFMDILKRDLDEIQSLLNSIDPEKLKENKAQFEKANIDLQASQRQLEEKANELSRVQGELTNAQTQVTSLSQEIQQLNVKERELTSNLENLNRNLESKNMENEDIKTQLQNINTQLSSIQNERDGLTQQLESNLTELRQLQEQQNKALEGLNRIKGLIENQLTFINRLSEEQDGLGVDEVINAIKMKLKATLDTITSIPSHSGRPTEETKEQEFPNANDFFNMTPEDKIIVVNRLKQQGASERLINILERVLTEIPLNRENVVRRYNDVVESFRTTRGGRRHRRKTMKKRRKQKTHKKRKYRGGYTYGKESPDLRSQSSEVSMMTSSSGKTSSRRKYRGTRRRSRS
jgi:chromosome segregation ATPase